MKFHFHPRSQAAAIVSFAVFLLMPIPTVQSEETTGNEAIYNPAVSACCNCITVKIKGEVPDGQPGEETGPFVQEVDGSYHVDVGVTKSNDGICSTTNIISVKVISISPMGGEVSLSSTGGIAIITADLVRKFGYDWKVVVECKGSPVPAGQESQIEASSFTGCEREFSLSPCESGCSSCDKTAGEPELTESEESAEAEIPTTSSAGGMSNGSLTFDVNAPFSGRSGLVANVPSTFRVNRNAGRIESIQTGAATLSVTDGPGENALTITHMDTNGAMFRTTTLSSFSAGGALIFTMDSTFDGTTTRHQRTLSQGGSVLEEGRLVGDNFEPLRQQTLVKAGNTARKTYRTKVLERASVSHPWHLVSDMKTTWEAHIFGWKKVEEVIDPDRSPLISSWVYYQAGDTPVPPQDPASPIVSVGSMDHSLGRLKYHIRPDGYLSFHTYGLFSESITTPFAGDPAGKTTTSRWDPGNQTQTIETKVDGIPISRTVRIHGPASMTEHEYTSLTTKLTTVHNYTQYLLPAPQLSQALQPSQLGFGGKSSLTRHPDDTLTTSTYTRLLGGGYTTVTDNGYTETENGETVSQGTRTTTTKNIQGITILENTTAIGYNTGVASFSSMAVTSVDGLGRALITAHHAPQPDIVGGGAYAVAENPAYTTATSYSCCGVATETDRYGITTYMAYDGLKRLIKSNTLKVTTETVRTGVPFDQVTSDGSIPTIFTKTHRYPEVVVIGLSSTLAGAPANLISETRRNLSETLEESWSPDPVSEDPGNLIKSSSTAITYNPGPPPVLKNNPSNIALSGDLGSLRVTTTPDNFSQYEYSYLDGSRALSVGDLAPDTIHLRVANATGITETRAYYDNDGPVGREITTTQSDWAGRTRGITYMDGSFARMEYNTRGQLVLSSAPDGVITLFEYNNRGAATTTAVDLNRNGLIDYGTDTASSSETTPAIDAVEGPVLKTISKVWHANEATPPEVVEIIVSISLRSPSGLSASSQSIGVANPATSKTLLGQDANGLGTGNWTTTSTSPDGTFTRDTYRSGLMDISENFGSNSNFISSTSMRNAPNAPLSGYDTLNRPTHQRDSRTGVTTTTYLSATADFVKSVSEPGSRLTGFTYDSRGRRTHVDAPDTFDAAGAPLPNITITHYFPDGNVRETTGAQTYRTTYTYDYAQRMRTLTTYGTETATTTWNYSPDRGYLTRKEYHDGKGTDYSYTTAGRLKTRRWARGNWTRYDYDSAGRLGATLYFTSSTTEAFVLAPTTTAGNDPSTPDVLVFNDNLGRPQTITQPNQSKIEYDYDPDTLRLDTETISYNLDSVAGYEFSRVLDRKPTSLGRDTGWQLKNGPTVENEATYGYSPTDGRLRTVSNPQISNLSFTYNYLPNSNLIERVTGPVHDVVNLYEPNRDVLDTKTNKLAITVISAYDYAVNAIGQRTGVTTSGTAFPALPTWIWGYDSLGQVTSADSSINTNDRAYQFDAIGNRKKITNTLTLPSSDNYTANALNQYSLIQPSEGGTGVSPVHDFDGNATAYPLPTSATTNSTLIWDGENRLTEVKDSSGTTLEKNVFDSGSRKIATTANGVTTIYLYDQWNCIAEYEFNLQNSSFSLSKARLWGMDLSGSMQGAGGVGGLLCESQISNSQISNFYPTYDGNGNVSEYLTSIGAVAAHFEYDPFGNTVVNTDTSNQFAYRFSTKPLAFTTGLYYYGYRYYDPLTGRWPSRDPIEEEGGVNMYGFVGNDGVNKRDKLGLFPYFNPGQNPAGTPTPEPTPPIPSPTWRSQILGGALAPNFTTYFETRFSGWHTFATKEARKSIETKISEIDCVTAPDRLRFGADDYYKIQVDAIEYNAHGDAPITEEEVSGLGAFSWWWKEDIELSYVTTNDGNCTIKWKSQLKVIETVGYRRNESQSFIDDLLAPPKRREWGSWEISGETWNPCSDD